MSAVLILFIDGLSLEGLARMPQLSRWPVRRLQPGFGYSVNLHPELFAGLTPDEAGFFCDWTYDPQNAPGRAFRRVLPGLDRICRPYVLNRGVQSLIVGWVYPGARINLPLGQLHNFGLWGRPIDAPGFPRPSLFTNHPELVVLSKRSGRKGERDGELVAGAEHAIDSGVRQLFVPFPDLDGIAHAYGLASPQYQRRLESLDGWVEGLALRFLKHHPGGRVFALSDHGMATVREGVRLNLERVLGPADQENYLYFTDATLLRVWLRDPRLQSGLCEYLQDLGWGRVVTREERQRFGLTSPAFGTVIYQLHEGLAFEPSYFARHKPKAMHGYHPDTESQTALLLGQPHGESLPDVQRSVEAFTVLDAALGGEN